MKITQIVIENFRPFYGKQSMDLTPAHDNPLIIVDADNESGKTSIFLAITWALYGHVEDRQDKQIPFYETTNNEMLLNGKAYAEHSNEPIEMSVRIQFEHPHKGENQNWDLTRTATLDLDSDGNSSVKENVALKIGPDPITSSDVDDLITDVMHIDTAKFHLFDGEVLSNYEGWLEGDSNISQAKIKQAIEHTVGTSVFRMKESLSEVTRTAYKAVKAAERKDTRLETLTDEEEVRKQQLEGLKDALELAQRHIHEVQAKIDETANADKALGEWQKAQAEITRLEENIEDEHEKVTTATKDITELITDNPWLALGTVPLNTREELLGRIEATLTTAPHLAQQSLDHHFCSLCNTQLTEESEQILAETISSSPKGISDFEEITTISENLRKITPFLASEEVFKLLTNLTSGRDVAAEEAQGCIEQVQKLRNKHPTKGNKGENMEVLGKLHEDKADSETEIQGFEEEASNVEGEIRTLREKINKLKKTDPALDKRYLAAEFLEDVVEKSLEQFRLDAKKKIQDEASRMFKILNDPANRRTLKIDDNYGLSTYDSDGKKSPAKSAGGSQMLTLALLFGLNQQTNEDAPMIVDTPFGRLDSGNRKRFFDLAKTLIDERNQQIVLFFHDGESDHANRTEYGVTPGRLYEIVKKEPDMHHEIQVSNV